MNFWVTTLSAIVAGLFVTFIARYVFKKFWNKQRDESGLSGSVSSNITESKIDNLEDDVEVDVDSDGNVSNVANLNIDKSIVKNSSFKRVVKKNNQKK